MAEEASETSIQVVTYNVLVPELCNASIFPKCSPASLDNEKRFGMVMNLLEEEVRRGALICLQELGPDWVGRLHAFFSSRNYALISRMYRARRCFNAVGVAVPLSLYDVEEVGFRPIAGLPDWMIMKKQPGRVERWLQTALDVARTLTSIVSLGIFMRDPPPAPGSPPPGLSKNQVKKLRKLEMRKQEKLLRNPFPLPPDDQLRHLRSAANEVVAVTLQRKGGPPRPFVVSTCHLPHAKYEPASTYQAATFLQKLQALVKQRPLICAGDFNLTPDSIAYALLCKAPLADYRAKLDFVPEGVRWSPQVSLAVRSSYALHTHVEAAGASGRDTDDAWESAWSLDVSKLCRLEPRATMNAYGVYDGPGSRTLETRDYIFITRDFRVGSRKALPAKHEYSYPWPDAKHASDHIPIGVTLHLATKEEKEQRKRKQKLRGKLVAPSQA